MSARSLNKVILIGNLTRDPELRYTPAGTAVCTMGLATNRSWTTQTGETKEETEFHRIVAWNKLAELCAQLLTKGRKVYVEGRLSTHSWTGQDGNQRTTTEIVIEDMILLDSKKSAKEEVVAVPPEETSIPPEEQAVPPVEKLEEEASVDQQATSSASAKSTKKKTKVGDEDKKDEDKKQAEETKPEDITPDDIPF